MVLRSSTSGLMDSNTIFTYGNWRDSCAGCPTFRSGGIQDHGPGFDQIPNRGSGLKRLKEEGNTFARDMCGKPEPRCTDAGLKMLNEEGSTFTRDMCGKPEPRSARRCSHRVRAPFCNARACGGCWRGVRVIRGGRLKLRTIASMWLTCLQ